MRQQLTTMSRDDATECSAETSFFLCAGDSMLTMLLLYIYKCECESAPNRRRQNETYTFRFVQFVVCVSNINVYMCFFFFFVFVCLFQSRAEQRTGQNNLTAITLTSLYLLIEFWRTRCKEARTRTRRHCTAVS